PSAAPRRSRSTSRPRSSGPAAPWSRKATSSRSPVPPARSPWARCRSSPRSRRGTSPSSSGTPTSSGACGCGPTPTTRRTPPGPEFLPDIEELLVRQARGELSAEEEVLLAAARSWQEVNPMLGTRGCRLGIIKPGLYKMQVRALMQAAVERKQAGGDPRVEIMIPLVVSGPELQLLVNWTREEAQAVIEESGVDIAYLVGTMIETPRAAIDAAAIGAVAEFFSFGTNDLTQMTFGFSRDDVEGRIMTPYLEKKLLHANPFETLDQAGVGELVRWACAKGRGARATL